MNDFNRIAPVYDLLASIVFFGRIRQSQRAFLSVINPNEKVLIIGGGAGSILKDLDVLNLGLQITYVEMSSAMIKKAQKVRLQNESKPEFVINDFLKLELNQKYDIIICNYFLDVFIQKDLDTVIEKIKRALKPNARLLVADFEISEGHLWQRFLSYVTHRFFVIIANLSSRFLLNHHQLLLLHGYSLIKESRLYKGFIVSRVYKYLPK